MGTIFLKTVISALLCLALGVELLRMFPAIDRDRQYLEYSHATVSQGIIVAMIVPVLYCDLYNEISCHMSKNIQHLVFTLSFI